MNWMEMGLLVMTIEPCLRWEGGVLMENVRDGTFSAVTIPGVLCFSQY